VRNSRVALVAHAVFFSSFAAFAQPPAGIVSPEVQSDGHVTFRFRAPNAIKVEVAIEGQTTHTAMQKDERGIWSVTVGPDAAPIFTGTQSSPMMCL